MKSKNSSRLEWQTPGVLSALGRKVSESDPEVEGFKNTSALC